MTKNEINSKVVKIFGGWAWCYFQYSVANWLLPVDRSGENNLL